MDEKIKQDSLVIQPPTGVLDRFYEKSAGGLDVERYPVEIEGCILGELQTYQVNINDGRTGDILTPSELGRNDPSRQLRDINADDLDGAIKECRNSTEIESVFNELFYEVGSGRIFGRLRSFEKLIDTLNDKKAYGKIIFVCMYWLENRSPSSAILTAMFKAIVLYGIGEWSEAETVAIRYLSQISTIDGALAEAFNEYFNELIDMNYRDEGVLGLLESKAKDIIQADPMKEKGYYDLATIKQIKGNNEDAEYVLRIAILEKQLPREINRKPEYISCPHCCTMLLKMLDNDADSALIVRIAAKGLIDSTDKKQEQYFLKRLEGVIPPSNLAYERNQNAPMEEFCGWKTSEDFLVRRESHIDI